ncbi:hypothetical protein EVAR_101514_1 [Eumeta japonica]|uniref:Uncharacterized protein n=1 Tax=Eumeta variegata TaxID=151549 RepID=A0A4C1TEY6_EUMVA|nr:hypothetical protein EVAR_101514_1 [Eumeta japonica]
MAYRIFRGENAYDCAIGYIYRYHGVGRPRVIPKEKLPTVVEVPIRLQHRSAVAYQQTVLEIPGRVVAVKLRHDAHLPASSHLFGMPGLWKARGAERELARNSKQGVCVNCYLSLQECQAWWYNMVYSHSVDLVHRQARA